MKVTNNINKYVNDIVALLKKLKSMDEVKEQDVTSEHCGFSQYARCFDDASTAWTKYPEYNKMFLFEQEKLANEKLKKDGYLFLNDVYQMLGMQKSKLGHIVGWIYDEKNPISDNFVDFGLDHERNRGFINGDENVAILDFNVYGNIYALLCDI